MGLLLMGWLGNWKGEKVVWDWTRPDGVFCRGGRSDRSRTGANPALPMQERAAARMPIGLGPGLGRAFSLSRVQ